MKPVRMGATLGVQPNNKQELYDYRARVSLAASAAMGDELLLDGPVTLVAVFVLERLAGHFGTGRNAGKLKASAPVYSKTKPDLSKLLRALEDGMTGVVFKDDAQVAIAEVSKLYADQGRGPMTLVTVEQHRAAGETPQERSSE